MGTNSVNQENNKIIKNDCPIIWMCCPKCFLIPSIKPFLMKGELYISIYCKCLYDEKLFMKFQEYKKIMADKKTTRNFCKKHSNIEGFSFCISCEKWLCKNCFIVHKEKNQNHLFYNKTVRIKEYCHSHEKELAVGYCNNCCKNICENCKKSKKKLRHDVFDFYDEDKINKCFKEYENFINFHVSSQQKRREIKEEMINSINNSKDISDDDKTILINRLTDVYNKNNLINNQLMDYFAFLSYNFYYCFKEGGMFNRNILFNIFNLKIDNITFTIKPQLSVIKNAEKLIKYFEEIYIIELNPLVNIKNISSERENVTKQISNVCILEQNIAATLTSKGIIIVWNYLNYEELYRIKKITMYENIYLEKFNKNQLKAKNPIDNDFLFFIGDEDDDEDLINERVFFQQAQILNSIQKNNNINENKKITILKVYNTNNNEKLNSSNDSEEGKKNDSDTLNKNEINNINNKQFNDNEDIIDLNYNFSSMAYIKKHKLLCLTIDNCNDIYLFDVIKKETLKEKLIGHKKEVLDILALQDESLASYGRDSAIRIWNMKKFQNTLTIKVEIKKYYIYFKQLLYGNLIFATDKSVIKILKLPEYEFDKDITSVSQPMNYFELPDKKLIISSDDFHVRLLKPPDYKEVILFYKARTKIYSFLLFDINKLLIGLENNEIHLINLKNKNKNRKISTHLSHIGTMVKTNEIDQKNNRIISISWDNEVKVFLIAD